MIEKPVVKIPVLNDTELKELYKVLYLSNDELSRKRFWREVYKRRGMKYKEVFYQ